MSRVRRQRRPPVVYVSWSSVAGRSQEIAATLGGEAKTIFYAWGTWHWLVPLRYAISCLHTLLFLLRARPRSIIATLPPVFPGLVAYLYALLARVPLVLDSHPSSFGLKGNKTSQRLLPVHRWLIRRASATMVTTPDWTRVVEEWGGHGIVVHEAPPSVDCEPPPPLGGRPRILYVGVFSSDEPVEAVVEAARELQDVDLWVTGRLRRAPKALLAAAPPNVCFAGYLGPLAYRRAIAEANVVVALTTEPTSIMRAAYEAVYARRPLVLSDWPRLRESFPFGVYVANDASSISRGIRCALHAYERLVAQTTQAHEEQERRWWSQHGALRESLGLV